MENIPSEERKQSKNHSSPVKLESKIKDKKIIDPGWEVTFISKNLLYDSEKILRLLNILSLNNSHIKKEVFTIKGAYLSIIFSGGKNTTHTKF